MCWKTYYEKILLWVKIHFLSFPNCDKINILGAVSVCSVGFVCANNYMKNK